MSIHILFPLFLSLAITIGFALLIFKPHIMKLVHILLVLVSILGVCFCMGNVQNMNMNMASSNINLYPKGPLIEDNSPGLPNKCSKCGGTKFYAGQMSSTLAACPSYIENGQYVQNKCNTCSAEYSCAKCGQTILKRTAC